MWEELLNLPAQSILRFIQKLITEEVSMDVFGETWAVINYVLSTLYVLLLLYAGIKFMTSGHDLLKKEKARELIKNVILLIVSVQASFYIYGIVVFFGSALTKGMFNLVNTSFFSPDLSMDYFLYLAPYYLMIILTSLLLIIRYAIVCIGVIIFPLALFCYFIEPLKQYGEMIINFLLVNIFMGFLVSIIILTFSKISALSLFDDFQMLLLTACFLLINISIIYFSYFALIKSAFNTGSKIAVTVAKYLA
jgi:hypothetical protein